MWVEGSLTQPCWALLALRGGAYQGLQLTSGWIHFLWSQVGPLFLFGLLGALRKSIEPLINHKALKIARQKHSTNDMKRTYVCLK